MLLGGGGQKFSPECFAQTFWKGHGWGFLLGPPPLKNAPRLRRLACGKDRERSARQENEFHSDPPTHLLDAQHGNSHQKRKKKSIWLRTPKNIWKISF